MEILCEHGIFGVILFTFSVHFLKIKIFFNKSSNSKLNFKPQNELILCS